MAGLSASICGASCFGNSGTACRNVLSKFNTIPEGKRDDQRGEHDYLYMYTYGVYGAAGTRLS